MQQCSAIELCLYFSWVRGSISPEALVVFMVASFVIPSWLSWPVKLLETRTSSNKLMCITQQCHFKTQHVQKVNRVDSILKTSQELRTLSRSLSDCQSQTLNVRVKVSQFVRKVNCVTKSPNHLIALNVLVFVRKVICLYDSSAVL